MQKYLATFTGRLKGAIGVFELFENIPIEAENRQAAELKLYDKHQDISGLEMRPILKLRGNMRTVQISKETGECEVEETTITPRADAAQPIAPSLPDELQHTPGPWEANEWGNGWEVCAPESHYTVCNLSDCNNAEANAALIAAAPGILATLRNVLNHNAALKPEYQLPSSLVLEIRNAISSAL